MARETVFRLVFFATLGLLAVIRGYFAVVAARATGRKLVSREQVRNEGSRSVMARRILALVVLGAMVLYAVDPAWARFLHAPLPDWLRWAGAGLGVLAAVGLTWVHGELGRFWSASLELEQEHKLITSGPYALARHPMYTTGFSYMIALALISANWLVMAGCLAAVAVFASRIGKEEAMMVSRFGDEYRAYMARTPRFWPKIGRHAPGPHGG